MPESETTKNAALTHGAHNKETGIPMLSLYYPYTIRIVGMGWGIRGIMVGADKSFLHAVADVRLNLLTEGIQ